jgi:amino acid adenylation domain-containing protein
LEKQYMTTTSLSNSIVEQHMYALPTSFAQQRLWILDQVNPQSAAYNLFPAVRISIPLNIEVLEQSLNAIIERHEILRTIFAMRDGQPMQIILPSLKVPFQVIDLEHLPEAQRESEMLRLANEEAQQPFDLAHGPLLRTMLFRLGTQDYLLLLTIHHIIFDGWSGNLFFHELATLYQAFDTGQPATLPPLPIQYADFAVWQKEQLQGELLEEQLAYWKKQLADAPTTLELPTDYPRPAASPRGSTYLFTFSQSLTDSLKALSRREGVSLYTTLVASFQTMLYRYTGQDDLLLGTDIADRSQEETEDLIGFFVNTNVLRCNLSGNPTFSELLQRVSKVVIETQGHQDTPFEYLVKELHPDRSPGQNPFFQVMFSLESPTRLLPSQWVMTPLEIQTGATKFDMSLELEDRPEGILGYLEYNADLFEATTIERIVGHWQRLLENVVANPNQRIADLPLLTEPEWQQQVVTWNTTQAAYPHEQCFHDLFEAQVERTPQAVAVVCEQEQLSYQELNQRANHLARSLQALGVGPETIVPLLAERGIDFLIAILAVFKAGGAYLPLDPRHPPSRIRQILQHSGSRFVLAAKDFAPLLSMQAETSPRVLYLEDLQLQNGHAEGNLPVRVTPRNLAYVIYTSGSTGLPKGVMIEQRGMLNHLYAKISALQLTATDRVAQTASQCFDISVWQFLSALLVGGRVHIFPDRVAHDPMPLLTQVERYRISILETVPSLLRVMLESIESGSDDYPRLEKLRWLIPTGEALPPEFCRRWLSIYPRIPLLNAYGPTECSDDVTHFPICQPLADWQLHTPIGRPISNMRLYILDGKLRPLPIGVSGELYVGGIGVGRGYLNEPQRTAEAFLPDPFSTEAGARLYKTGDLARYLPDGNIEFLGRVDHQVKIRGYRIELGEIESLLRQHSTVQDVVVVVREEIPGDKSLVAYVVTSHGGTETDLRNYLKERLPNYMVPTAFVLLESLPLTPNGKVDRRALPAPEHERLEQNEGFVAPTLPTHQQLIQIWEELLEVRPIGIRDNFFDLGGHSLLALRLISRIEQVFSKKISPNTLLADPTIEQLAHVLTQSGETSAVNGNGTVRSGNPGRSSSEHGSLLSSIKTIWTRSRSSDRKKNARR